MVFGLILYRRSVVGEIVNYTGVIYGARIHRTVALRMRLRMDIMVKFIGAENIYVRYFWGRYFINTALLVIIHILYTKMGGRTSLFLTSQRMPSRYNAYMNT